MNKEKIEKLIAIANNKFGSDFKLIGSWKIEGYSNHDIDVFTEKEKHVDESGLWLAKQTGMIIDVYYPACGRSIGSWGSYVIHPDGKAYFWIEEVMKEVDIK